MTETSCIQLQDNQSLFSYTNKKNVTVIQRDRGEEEREEKGGKDREGESE